MRIAYPEPASLWSGIIRDNIVGDNRIGTRPAKDPSSGFACQVSSNDIMGNKGVGITTANSTAILAISITNRESGNCSRLFTPEFYDSINMVSVNNRLGDVGVSPVIKNSEPRITL